MDEAPRSGGHAFRREKNTGYFKKVYFGKGGSEQQLGCKFFDPTKPVTNFGDFGDNICGMKQLATQLLEPKPLLQHTHV